MVHAVEFVNNTKHVTQAEDKLSEARLDINYLILIVGNILKRMLKYSTLMEAKEE
jgi:hypothetical protein